MADSDKSREGQSPADARHTNDGRTRQTLLVISQVYVPDPASVGQHMADVAAEMAARGYRVIVYAADRGYDDPTVRYPAFEMRNGVEIRRLPFSSFGKKQIIRRILGTFSFMVQSLVLALVTRNLRGIFFSTSPPLIGAVAATAGWIRRVPVAYWAMDLNPDQLIALGKLKPTSLAARFLERINRLILKRAAHVTALDRFMAERLERRVDLTGKLSVMPPWPHENHLEAVESSVNPFRARHGVEGKFVVMYSGNHSPSNPLDTLLEAALRLRDDAGVKFLFVGGGVGKKAVEAFIHDHRLVNCLALPYQPLADLKYSLSAADLHVVSLGSDMVGIIHPCKIYGAMSAGRAILFFGPRPSHVTDLLDRHPIGWHVAHGDVDAAVTALTRIRALPPAELLAIGATAQAVLAQNLSQSTLCGRFCDELETGLRLHRSPTPSTTRAGTMSDNNEEPTHAYPAHRGLHLPGAGM